MNFTVSMSDVVVGNWRWHRVAVFVACCAILAGARQTVAVAQLAERQPLTAERVRKAIDNGVNYLKRSQDDARGAWPELSYPKGGITALATLALLNSGVQPADASIREAIEYLDRIDVKNASVYSVSLMTMVYCAAVPDTRRARIRECVDFLVEAQIKRRGNIGGWSYRLNDGGGGDSSNTQFALLALHEAALVGIEIDPEVWLRSRDYWNISRDRQTGGYRYSASRTVAEPTGSMTCAGISSVVIIDENLPQTVRLERGRVQCCGDDDRLEEIEAATEWLAARFQVRRNPSQAGGSPFQSDYLYYLYGMERAARLTGQRYFGKHDWYREGAAHLTDDGVQSANGSWRNIQSSHGEASREIATSFALLFLAKGKRPVVIGKYRHTDDFDWDRHRRGVHYLTRRLETLWETQLNWQTVEGRVATADDLLESPVLFLSGRDGLRMNQSQKETLRRYVEYGGFIFAEACQGDGCGENVAFDADFRQLMAELFPESQLQLLDAAHPVFSAQYPLSVNPDRPLYGLQSSCRTSVVYCPRNLTGLWQYNRPVTLETLPDTPNGPRQQIEYCVQLGCNVVAYATGREVKDKLDRPGTIDDGDFGLGTRTVLIPKLSHGGGADDAPNAWQNIVRRAQFDLRERFRIERTMISPDMEKLAEFPMVFMHGRSPFTWLDQEKLALREYLTERGGFLFADTICSVNGFADSFRNEIRQILPGHAFRVIPADDPIWADSGGGYNLRQVSMHTRGRDGQVQHFRTPPQLEGVQIDGRWIVVFSPNDLSCAMENASPLQCPGYDKDDAARIGVNVILYALRR